VSIGVQSFAGKNPMSDLLILAITVLLIWKFSHGSNDNRKRHEMRLISKLGIVHFCSINERFPMFNSICQKADVDNTFNAYLIP
jgi:hypothetical protein